jgi:uncharacterized membrane protein
MLVTVRSVLLASAVALACAVEMVEALTIVLAVGITRGWRAVRWGIVAALAALATVVATLGPSLKVMPLDALRLVVGFLLLSFGLQWLRKAILRAAHRLPMHDEDEAFAREVAETRRATPVPDRGFDWYAFTVACKGVLLEGLEVAFIVVTFGAAHRDLPLAVAAALGALFVVSGAGAIVHRPLARVPENTMKLVVGLMLTAFGSFWGAEGAGARWPGGDAAIAFLLVVYAAITFALVHRLGRGARPALLREVA